MRSSWLGSFFTYTAWHSWPRSASRFMSVIEWRSAPPCTRDPVTKSARISGEVFQRSKGFPPPPRAELDGAVDGGQGKTPENKARQRIRGGQDPFDKHPGERGGERGARDAPAERRPVLQPAHRDAGLQRNAPEVDEAVEPDRRHAARGGAGEAEGARGLPADRDRENEREHIDAERVAALAQEQQQASHLHQPGGEPDGVEAHHRRGVK